MPSTLSFVSVVRDIRIELEALTEVNLARRVDVNCHKVVVARGGIVESVIENRGFRLKAADSVRVCLALGFTKVTPARFVRKAL